MDAREQLKRHHHIKLVHDYNLDKNHAQCQNKDG